MRKKGCGCCGGGCLFTLAVLAAIPLAFFATQPKPPLIPKRVLPSPNGYDDIIAAADMVTKTGGDKSLYDSNGSPIIGAEDAVLASNATALKLMRGALTKDCLVPITNDMNQSFTYLAGVRSMARLLDAEARSRLRHKQPAKAAESLLDASRLSSKVRSGGPVIHMLVGIAVRAIVSNRWEDVYMKLNAKECRSAADQLDEIILKTPTVIDGMEAERAWMLATMQRHSGAELFRQINSTGVSTDHDVLRSSLEGAAWDIMRPRTLVTYNDYMLALEQQWILPLAKRKAIPVPGGVTGILVPVFDQAFSKAGMDSARTRLWSIVLRIRAFQLQTGKLPLTLDEAGVPKAISLDPWTHVPMRYIPQGSELLLYSTGPDGKDDGGKTADEGISPVVGDIGVKTFNSKATKNQMSKKRRVPFMLTPTN